MKKESVAHFEIRSPTMEGEREETGVTGIHGVSNFRQFETLERFEK